MNDPVKHEIARDEKGKWLPGQSANPNGRPKRKTLTELLHERLDSEPNGWKELVDVILTLAKRKDKEIIKELWHYTDGMPTQKNEVKLDGQLETLVIIKDGSKTKSVADRGVGGQSPIQGDSSGKTSG